MGYYSGLHASMQQGTRERIDHSYPSRKGSLEEYLEILEERLAELDAIRPRNRMDPMYDRYFSSEYYTDKYGPRENVQDLLSKIYHTKMMILEKTLHSWKAEADLKIIEKTGATREGQIVLAAVFIPALCSRIIQTRYRS